MAPTIGVTEGAPQLRALRRIGIPPSRGSLQPLPGRRLVEVEQVSPDRLTLPYIETSQRKVRSTVRSGPPTVLPRYVVRTALHRP